MPNSMSRAFGTPGTAEDHGLDKEQNGLQPAAGPSRANQPRGPLSGVKVLEYGDFISAPFCTKLMADLGAEVVKIEHPEHPDSSRQHGPFLNDNPHPERSGLFLYLNANKLGVTLDVSTAIGANMFRQLLEHSDVVVENHPPGHLDKFGLGYRALREENPNLIMTSITPFGQTGPYRDHKAYAINCSAASGWSLMIGEPGREPLTPPLSMGHFISGLAGATATLVALLARRSTGRGQHIDISEVECLNSLLSGVAANAFVYYGRMRMRHGHRSPAAYPYAVLPCKDGYMWMIAIQGHEWKRFLDVLGNGNAPDWYENDPRFKDRLRAGREYADDLDQLLAPWLMAHTKKEIFQLCRDNHVPFAPVNNIDEVVNNAHLNARGFFVELEHPEAGRLKYPGEPYKFSKTPWRMQRPAPMLGEHNEEVYCGRIGYSRQELVQLRRGGVI